jgi:hypothetical protein
MSAPRYSRIETTRDKLCWLEEQAAQLLRQPPKPGHQHVRELTLRSLRKLINRMEEDLMRSDAEREVRP